MRGAIDLNFFRIRQASSFLPRASTAGVRSRTGMSAIRWQSAGFRSSQHGALRGIVPRRSRGAAGATPPSTMSRVGRRTRSSFPQGLRCANAGPSAARSRTALRKFARRSAARGRGSARSPRLAGSRTTTAEAAGIALHRLVGMVAFDHTAPHASPQGLDFLNISAGTVAPVGRRKPREGALATASSPGLACRSFACVPWTPGAFLPPRLKTADAPPRGGRIH